MSPRNLPTRSLDDNSVEKILIKLPIKSLMRLQCVSKRWQSLIQDPSFTKSHHSRLQKTQPPQLLISIDSYYDGESKIFYSPENEFKGGVAVPRVTIPWSQQTRMLKPINGLFCCVDDIYGVTCIFNLGTRQVTPWAQSCIPIQGGYSVNHNPIYGFGFDPLTNKYKLLRVWEITSPNFGYGLGRVDHICEVFTVGANQWRKINEVPPVRLFGGSDGVYANGSIYWWSATSLGSRTTDEKVIVVFDVGTEKFRVIPTPEKLSVEISGTTYYRDWSSSEKLLQIDGRLALMDTVSTPEVTLWISDDDSYKETTNWTEETISLDYCFQHGFPYGNKAFDLNPVQGTDEIIIKSYIFDDNNMVPRRFLSLYIYNRTTKGFRTIDVIFIAPLAYPYDYGLYIFHESLVHIQKPAPAEKKTQSTYIACLKRNEDCWGCLV